MDMRRILMMGMAGLTVGLLARPAFADVAGRYENTEEHPFIDMELTIEADEHGNIRLQMAGMPAYYLLRDGEFYVVGREADRTSVSRMVDAIAISQEAAARMGIDETVFNDAPEPEPMNFTAVGEERVGEWTGTAYGLAPSDGGDASPATFVISDDPRLAPPGKALVDSQKAMAAGMISFGRIGIMMGRVNAELVSLLEKGTPIRMTQLELTGYSIDPIDPERFALPAEPLTLDQLRAQQQEFPPPPTLSARAE
jgi:hypothetical protein